MVRPRGLDKAAKPLQSQTEKPAGNPTKKVRVKCGLPHWAVMQQGLHKKPLEIYFRGDICEIHAADFFELCCRKKAKKNGTPTGTRTQDPMIKSHLLYQLSYGRTFARNPQFGLLF